MEKIDDLKGWTVKQLEDAVDRRKNVKLEEGRIKRRKVVGANGTTELSGLEVRINWLWDGRASINGKREPDYDLNLE